MKGPTMNSVQKKTVKIALVGNPNVGKSVIFGCLTGRYVSVSNYPGTTVEVARGDLSGLGSSVSIIDTPGVNSLIPMSEDEQVTRDILLKEGIDQAIQVSDAKNLKRALLITLQLIEIGVPFLLDLNMADEAKSLGISIDTNRLATLLGIPVLETIAIQKKGMRELKKQALALTPSPYRYTYARDIEEGISQITPLLPKGFISRRSVAVMILSGDRSLTDWLHEVLSEEAIKQIEQIRADLIRSNPEPLSYRINKTRLRIIDEILGQVMKKEKVSAEGLAARFGRLCMHPFGGLFVMVAVLYGFYEFVGNFGAQIGVDFLENTIFANYLNPWATTAISKLFFFSPFLIDLFVGEYGVITMALTYAFALIFPIVLTFFIAFSLIEDSGYLPRLSIMLNRIFKFMGLNGKAVVPMVLGLGCDTMATMSARIMDTRKERII
ncbi:MAG: ferrous iron transporter B, partial [bacterium]|nr:ferrous iron transporter B [bacterium]